MTKNLHLEDFTKYTFLSGIKHSPDGKHACFISHVADLEDNGYQSHLWIYDLQNDNSFQLTGLGKERSFVWLTDEEILFSAIRNPRDQERQKKGEDFTIFYKINIHGGEAQEAFRVPLLVQDIKPLSDERFLLTCIYNPDRVDLSSLSDQERALELKKREEEKAYEVLEEIPYWSNGGGFISKNRSRLYLYDQSSNLLKPLTDELLQVDAVDLNNDKTKALFTGSEFTGMAPLTNSLYLADLVTQTVKKITPNEDFTYYDVHFLNETEAISRGNARESFGINENSRFYLVDLTNGEKKLLTPDFDKSTYNSVGSDCRYGGGSGTYRDQGYLYFVSTENDSSYLNRIDSRGFIEQLTLKTGSVDAYSVKDGEVLIIALRDLALQEVYRLKDGHEEQLTTFNSWVNSERKLSEPEKLSFETVPGITIDGWVLKPVDYVKGQKYPAILNIHGGPKTVYGTVFYHEMQYWANEGYFVFFCNPRGSDGKGNEFADIRGKYGTIDYDDLMRFTDLVLEKYPDIDANRVGVTGGSYGGFMTNWIIGHTDRFKAAASQRSISNWVSMGYTTDIGYYFAPDQIGATPWSDPNKLWEHSPLKYADQVKTPTLFIHSDEDYRCWVPEALQMFTALKFHGVESRLCLFKGETHELSRSGKPKARIRRLKEITTWFNRFLKV